MKLFIIWLVALVCTISLMSLENTYAVDQGPQYYTPGSSAFGIPYQEWLEKWWGWWFGIPGDVHPQNATLNYDSKLCSVNQKGPVWFLYDLEQPNVQVKCQIPVGKGILLPISTTMTDQGTTPNLDLKGLETNANNIETAPTNMIVKVDGKPIDVKNLFAKTNKFNVTIPHDFCYSCMQTGKTTPGSYPAYATGYFLLLHNLSAGEHTIELHVVDSLANTKVLAEKRGGQFNILVK
jgi:hypothetical protein